MNEIWLDRFRPWLHGIYANVYSEPITPGHEDITKRMAKEVIPWLPPRGFVLDVGCGQGPALDYFSKLRFYVIGTSLCDEDIAVCQAKGHEVLKCAQEDLDPFPARFFDCVWARHVLEHSVMPYWTLQEFKRVLKVGGILYVEVPAPETSCHHTGNRNHYSVLTDSMWQSLIQRSGFEIMSAMDLNFTTPMGPDTYFSYICRRL